MLYRHITQDKLSVTLILSREQQDAILTAYDYGLNNLTATQSKILDAVISDLKDQIHP